MLIFVVCVNDLGDVFKCLGALFLFKIQPSIIGYLKNK